MNLKVYAISLGLVLTAFATPRALAEERCKVSGVIPATGTTYTQQHAIDIGDVPGHQVRIVELHRTYPADTKPNCEGLKRKEEWIRGFSDYVDRNGPSWGYAAIVLENGDKIFYQYSGTSQTAANLTDRRRAPSPA
jgi:hypothetical protein